MKRHFIYICVIICVVATICIVYFTPNPILKAMYPKRYVLNCLVKTEDLLIKEYTYGRYNNPMSEYSSNFSITGVQDYQTNDLLNLYLYNDNNKVLFTIPQFVESNKHYGIFKNSELLKKYIIYPNIYNKCLTIKDIDKRYFKSDNSKSAFETTNEFTFILNKKGVKKISDIFIKTIAQDEYRQLYSQKLDDFSENFDYDILVRLNIDNHNRVIGANLELQKNKDKIYAEILLKDNTLINNIEFMLYWKSNSNNIIININSQGNHKLIDGAFDDKTTLTVVSSYLQMAKLSMSTNSKLAETGGNFTSNIQGKLLMLPINVDISGRDIYSDEKVSSDTEWNFYTTNLKKETIHNKVYTSFSKEFTPLPSNKEFSDLIYTNENEITQIINNIIDNFKNNFINLIFTS